METVQVSSRKHSWVENARPFVRREENNALLVRVTRQPRAPTTQVVVKRSRGLGTLPGRVGSTLKRKFWDSNELVSATAVQARDILASLYVNGKENTVALVREGGDQTVVFYRYARERAATTRLPYPFVPIRDRLVLPCFRAVEAVVQFLFSDRPSHYYREAKNYTESLPLGTTVILPSIYFAEGLAHVTLVIMQAPLPSSERVAHSVEALMDLGKRGLRNVGREVYYYVQLVDFHVTRTLARAQWDILGFGPYASLPRERRMEVMERMVDRYLSIRIPIRRYEFMTQIKWQNSQLHDDLIGSELITQRGGTSVEDDTWLDPDATWRVDKEHHGLPGADVMPLWFCWDDDSKTWQPFQMFEVRRLERAYRKHYKALHGRSPKWTDNPLVASEAGRRLLLVDSSTEVEGGTSSAGGSAGHSDSDGRDSTYEETSPFSPENTNTALLHHEVGPQDVFVNQGRYVVDLLRLCRFPVFWGYAGQGDGVRRGVWMHESKQGYLIPYPPRSAALLEDAYQYLKWYLAGEEALARARQELRDNMEADGDNDGSGSTRKNSNVQEEGAGVLLNLQVDGQDGDQLVQFRSLTDIWAVRKTWVGALSLFSRRRVRRGYGPYAGPPHHAPPPPKAQDEEEMPSDDEGSRSHPATSDEEGEMSMPQPQDPTLSMLDPDGPPATVAEEGKATTVEEEEEVEEHKDHASPMPAPTRDTALPEGSAHGGRKVSFSATTKLPDEGKEVASEDEEVCEIRKVKGKWRASRQPKSLDGTGHSFDSSHHPSSPSHGSDSLGDEAEYNSHSEEEQAMHDDADLNEPVEHLVLVVHGIGQAMKRVELGVTQLRSIVECCDMMRNNTDEIDKQQNADDSQRDIGQSTSHAPGKLRGRIEYLPVEWHTKFREKAGEGEEVSTAGHLRLRDITLSRIPHLRSFVNDALLDVLYFMSPAYHQVILDEVAAEMNRIVTLFRKHSRRFSGKISIAAHSLGGVICFDLLANQESVVELAEVRVREKARQDPRRQHLKYVTTSYPKLQFNVVNLFGLGSPIAVFLLVRRQHQALHTEFCLARCRRMYNIFHPYDPVAYRLEPFINASSYDADADLLPTWQGKYRVHYQVKKMVNAFWERLWQLKEDLEDGVEQSLEAVGLIEERERPVPEEREEGEAKGEENMWPEHDAASARPTMADRHARYGRLCWGERIDYSLQEKEIEITNEYIFALGAHVLYWASKDLSNFLLLQIKKYQDERPEDEAEHREGKGFEREEEEEGEGEGEGRPTVK